MLVLYTDYGPHDPYVGQVKAVLCRAAPAVPVIDLMHALPAFNAHAAAHLLDALARAFPPGAVFFCVVDPGVGGPRAAAVVEADGRWYVGPDNGLLSIVAGRAQAARAWHIRWRPEALSDTFHGRDLFAPVAGRLAAGDTPDGRLADWLVPVPGLEVRFDLADLPRVLYLDHYGNAWTGIRGGLAGTDATLEVKGVTLAWRRTFAEAAKGAAFWHVNSAGLIEIAANRGSAAELLGLRVGDAVRLSAAPGSHWH